MPTKKRKSKHPAIRKRRPIRNAVVISDTHVGCKLAVCPREGVDLDDGGTYLPSKHQLMLCDCWDEFWGEWVPHVTEGEPWLLVHNGDVIDGVHHQTTTPISHNFEDQAEAACCLLRPIVEKADKYYHIRGTEAHVGPSAIEEERLAKRLGAYRTDDKQYARWDLWLSLGKEERLVHFLHHIGTCSSAAYESTAVMRELIASWIEAARRRDQIPDMVVRSHRHRYIEVIVPTSDADGRAIVTPGWQLKVPLIWRLESGRQATPQIGGVVLRVSNDGELYTRKRMWTVARSKTEKPTAIY